MSDQSNQSSSPSIQDSTEPVVDVAYCVENQETYITYDQFATDPVANAQHYNNWAHKYDEMHTKAGFNDPYWLARVSLENLAQSNLLSSKDAKLIDFGCGTGRLGVELKKQGYTNIAAVDGSTEMLTIANEKGCYNWTDALLIGCEPMIDELLYREGENGSGFDAAFASAVMLPGHFPNTCFEEMLKVLRPGGYLIFSIRDVYFDPTTDEGCGFKPKIDELLAAGKMKLVSSTPYRKYQGLDLGPFMSENPASVKIYAKTEA